MFCYFKYSMIVWSKEIPFLSRRAVAVRVDSKSFVEIILKIWVTEFLKDLCPLKILIVIALQFWGQVKMIGDFLNILSFYSSITNLKDDV